MDIVLYNIVKYMFVKLVGNTRSAERGNGKKWIGKDDEVNE